ncbi:MAG: hypothetical protein ABIJ34_06105 [archaeon]
MIKHNHLIEGFKMKVEQFHLIPTPLDVREERRWNYLTAARIGKISVPLTAGFRFETKRISGRTLITVYTAQIAAR